MRLPLANPRSPAPECGELAVASPMWPAGRGELGVASWVSGSDGRSRTKAQVSPPFALATPLMGAGLSPLGSILEGWSKLLIAPLVLAIVLLLLGREVLRRREKRAVFQLLPSVGFRPSMEDIRRFLPIFQARPSFLRRLLGMQECAVLRLRRRSPSDTVFFLEVPERLARRIPAACYPGVALVKIDPGLDHASKAGDAAAEELILRRDSIHALRRVEFSPDPKGPLCAVLDGLCKDEEAEVTVALWPADGPWHRHLATKRHAQSPSQVLADMWWEFKNNRPPPRRARDLPDKAGGTPVFRTRVFLRAASSRRERARALVSDLAWGFAIFDGDNSLRRAGALRRVLGRGALTSAGMERALGRGTLPSRRHHFLSLPELAGLLYPPAADCRGEHVARAEAAPASASLPEYALPQAVSSEKDPEIVLPLGLVRSGGAEREVGIAAADLTGPVYVSGRARSGKTWLLEAMAIHLAAAGAGFCFLDPHADAATELTQYLAGRMHDLLLVDLSRQNRQVGLNPLECHDHRDVADVVSRIVGAFQAAYGWGDRTHPRLMNLTRMATQALVEANLHEGPGRRQATLFDISALLTTKDSRDALLPGCSAPVRDFFLSEYRYEPGLVAPLLDKISSLRADPRTRLLLAQAQSTFDARGAMDGGEAVLVSLAGLGDKGQLVGSLIIYELFRAAKARADLPAPERRPFFLICDEVQLYQSPVLAAACGEAPKYGVKLVLANQFVGHLTEEVRGAILANYSQLVCFTTDHHDATVLAHELGPPVRAEDLVSLPRFECLARVTAGTERLPAFRAKTLDIAERYEGLRNPSAARTLRDASDRRATRTAEEIDGPGKRLPDFPNQEYKVDPFAL